MAVQYVIGTVKKNQGATCRYIEYNGRLAKNVTGNLVSKASPRSVRHYEELNNPRCVVKVFQKYVSYIPPSGRFYRRPLYPRTPIPLV